MKKSDRKLMQEFHDFCAVHPPKKRYTYSNVCKCAVAQFAKTRGEQWVDIVWPLGDYWADTVGELLDGIASYRPHTFGALTERLATALA